MNDTIEILTRRRSVPPPMMSGPAPSPDELTTILTVASRVPDHGKLAPWRFVVFAGQARERASRLALEIRLGENPDLDEAVRAEEARRFVRAPLVVAVVLTLGGMAALQMPLGILHLVGLLLIVAVGSNYALFFDQVRETGRADADTLASLMLANLTTVLSFGLIAISDIPALSSIGRVVAPAFSAPVTTA